MATTARNRYYSAPPALHNVDMMHGWSDTAVASGNTSNPTGNWIPFNLNSDGSLNVNINSGINLSLTGVSFSVSSVAVTGGNITINSGSFVPTFIIITNSQTQIPVGVRSYAISIISGSAFINGTGPISAYTNIAGGGYDGRWILNAPINVGGTGTVSVPSNIVISYES